MQIKITTLAVSFLLFFSFSILIADDGGLIAENSAGNFFGIGARSMGMGGAHIAAVMDGSALIYNPAALARIRRIEILGGITFQNYDNTVLHFADIPIVSGLNNRSQNNTRLNNIVLSVPYPTYRGSLVLAVGLNRIKSFDKTFKIGYIGGESNDFIYEATELENGSLYAISAGIGADISPRISIGGALNYYFGTDNYEWMVVSGDSEPRANFDIHDNIEDKYSAVSARVGLLLTPNQIFKFGISVETPLTFSIDEDYTLRTSNPLSDDPFIDAGEYSYDLSVPFSLGFGTAVNLNRLQLAADITYNQWTQMEYKDDINLIIDNANIQRFYEDVMTVAVGAEYLIPRIGLKLRAGYLYDPIPLRNSSHPTGGDSYNGYEITNERDFITLGAGYLFDRIMTMDVAFVLGGYTQKELSTLIEEDVDLSRVYVTFGLRL